jgi:rhamnosyltransferase
MSDKHSVGFVIRCLNEERHIGRLLAGLERQTRTPDQIVVVDSGSTDATVDIANHFGCDVVHIAPDDFTFGRALNVGCRAAKTDLMVFVSAHVYPVFDTYLEHMVAPFADPQVALAYGRQVGDHRTKYSESRVMLKWFPTTSSPKQEHGFCNNANAIVRRSVWEEIPYDEELTGLEDLDWATKAQDKGYSIAYVAESPVVHVHEESWKRIVNRYRREAIAYKRIMGQQTMTPWEAAKLFVGNTASDYVHAAREGVLPSNLTSIPSFRLAQFLGAYQGFKDEPMTSEQLKRRFYYPLEITQPIVEGPAPGKPIDYADEEPEG